jgi:CRISP-associated protein Cas1
MERAFDLARSGRFTNLTEVVKTLDREGYDPMLGIMYYERDGVPALVFDLMEPGRPKVDRAVLGFLKLEKLHPADFTMREDGVVRINPELARRVAKLAADRVRDGLGG